MRSKRAKKKEREREILSNRYYFFVAIQLSFACWQTQFDRPSERVLDRKKEISRRSASERERGQMSINQTDEC